MLVPLSWLRDFAPIDLPLDELVTLLGELGTPVESVREVGAGLDGVVIAKVLTVDRIEGADKIRAVTVDDGLGEPTPVVCGAWNFEAGATVPFARVGAVLPGDFVIGKRKMKGVESRGMICSAAELDLGDDHAGIMVLPDGIAEPGTPFADAMGITRDVVLELEINANRPDAMSIAGVARDLAAKLEVSFALPTPKVAPPSGDRVAPITNDAPDVCGRFVGQVLTGVQIGASPAWIANRLTLAGMRPINNVVDASNYVMLELGIPNHTYDLDRLPGGGLGVRHARHGEVLVTLDEVDRALTVDDVVITDAEDTPVGIAGVMGGASSEISDATTDVVLEAAWWKPIAIARTSKRLNLRTEASARFEKGTDWAMIDLAVARFAELLGLTPAGPTVDVGGELPDRSRIRVRVARVNAMLGTELTAMEMKGYLDRIGFTSEIDGDTLHVALPSWRLDTSTEIEVIEEVARLHGYSRIERTVPRSPLAGGLTRYQKDRSLVRHILAGYGALESWTTTFVSRAQVERAALDVDECVVVTNPLVADENLLRPSLLPGLVASIAYNESHRQPRASLFEVGKTFRRPATPRGAGGSPQSSPLPDEREMVAVAVAGADAQEAVTAWNAVVEGLLVHDVRLEGASTPGLHPTRTARVVVDGEAIGWIGEVDPDVLRASDIVERVAWLEVDLERLLGSDHGANQYDPISRFPSSDVDLAFEIDDDVPAGDVEQTLRAAGVLVADVRLFDIYRGDQVAAGRRSLAYTIRLQASDRTLTDGDVAAARQELIAAVESAHGATLRG